MKHRTLAGMAIIAAALAAPMVSNAAETTGSSTAKSKEYVKDSMITTKVKAELAAEKASSLAKIHVETDNTGAVTLTGTAANQMAKEKAVSITQGVKGVTSVDNQIKVVAE